MVEVNEDVASASLRGLAKIFADLLSRISYLDMYEIRILILALSQYLYCKYYTFGKRTKNDKDVDMYTIDAKTMNLVYSDETLRHATKRIIATRNMIGHDINSENTNDHIDSLRNSKSFIRLLKYEGLIDASGKYIEPEGGEYSLYELRPDIEFKIDPQKLAK